MNLRSLFALLVFTLSHLIMAQETESYYTINWLDQDLSPYDTYSISNFEVNGVSIDYQSRERADRFFKLFNSKMKRFGFELVEEATLQAEFIINVDTLPSGYQRIETGDNSLRPEDQIVEITLILTDEEIKERLVTATVYRSGGDPKKAHKRVKEMMNEFFQDAEIPAR